MPPQEITTPEPERLMRFWGVRGSIPTPGHSTARYGGNTTCLEIRIGGQILIIDAGSGISHLGSAILDEFGATPLSLTILNTHTHWDHIQGFPFFIPAYIKGNRIHIIGKNPGRDSLKSIFEKQMDGQIFFPVPLEAMQCQLSFDHLDPDRESEFQIDHVRISTCPTNHPGGCLAYRFESSGGSLVFLSDHETHGQDEQRILQFIQNTDILIADTQYTPDEAEKRRGWGHGCSHAVVKLALKAGIKTLYTTHHDPAHTDDFIDAMLEDARSIVPESSRLRIHGATEREEILF